MYYHVKLLCQGVCLLICQFAPFEEKKNAGLLGSSIYVGQVGFKLTSIEPLGWGVGEGASAVSF